MGVACSTLRFLYQPLLVFETYSNYMQPPQCPIQGDNHCAGPPGHIWHLWGDIHVKIDMNSFQRLVLSKATRWHSHLLWRVARQTSFLKVNTAPELPFSRRNHPASPPLHSISRSKHWWWVQLSWEGDFCYIVKHYYGNTYMGIFCCSW